MDLVSTIRKSGSRGGVNFSWDDVASSNHRENYLGHSLKAPVGRWQKGRDLNWYANSESTAANSEETDQERQERERKEEMRKVKEAEEDAMARALGLPVPQRDTTGANSVEVGTQRQIGPASRPGPEAKDESKSGRRKRRDDGERRERRRQWSRSRSRDGDRDRQGRHHHRRRDHSADRRERHEDRRDRHEDRAERRRHAERSRSREYDRRDGHRRNRERRPPGSTSGDQRRRSFSPRARR